eukprot:CAMPEP_0115068566 /NCGR_PEP_ID=MMETSP0227-20121206/12043_1 /TAXON_ID=89957 /ORGANISM="Polarella glacialis, Strain CCMP 1383" /LENGTH=182 /DNA_ID=CAMNT_0002454811 /DNA_START=120 /DNA_END=668 /DNA_ORIENTATION=+
MPGLGKSTTLGNGATLSMNPSDVRRAVVSQVTANAVAANQKSLWRESGLTGEERRMKDAKEGLNNLGMSLMSKGHDAGWGWCMGGRQQPALGDGLQKSHSNTSLHRPVSFPADNEQSMGLSRSESTSRMQSEPHGETPFFGEPRAFGDNGWDGRMRGGGLARSGWAGTFPLTHSRGCMPWAG